MRAASGQLDVKGGRGREKRAWLAAFEEGRWVLGPHVIVDPGKICFSNYVARPEYYLARDLRHDARADRLAPLAEPYPLAQENVDPL